MKDPNKFKSYLKFTFECAKNSINSLDLNVNFNHVELTKNVYIKPSDCHRYLLYRSFDPHHLKRSIVYSQTLRASRLY